MDKNEFMRACREGGAMLERALRQLDGAYHALLAAESRRVIRNGDAARDVVQETFIRVWQRCATFHGDSELLPWIRAILRNGILDWLRRSRREVPFGPDQEMSDEAMHALLDGWQSALPTPVEEARRAELDQCFRRCWRRFEEAAPMHATVIGWIAEDGLSNEDIGALLERTPGATREFVSQCRKRARTYLSEWYALARDLETAR